jgi:hypothetical protein
MDSLAKGNIMTYRQLLAAIKNAQSMLETVAHKKADRDEAYHTFAENTYGRALADERVRNADAALDEDINFEYEY